MTFFLFSATFLYKNYFWRSRGCIHVNLQISITIIASRLENGPAFLRNCSATQNWLSYSVSANIIINAPKFSVICLNSHKETSLENLPDAKHYYPTILNFCNIREKKCILLFSLFVLPSPSFLNKTNQHNNEGNKKNPFLRFWPCS